MAFLDSLTNLNKKICFQLTVLVIVSVYSIVKNNAHRLTFLDCHVNAKATSQDVCVSVSSTISVYCTCTSFYWVLS